MDRVAGLQSASVSRSLLQRIATAYWPRIAAISALGLAGRLVLLGYQPLWRDEAFTAVVVQRPLGPMLDAVRADSAPPLAYILDHAIATVWSSPAGLRVLSALGGALAIPLAAALGRRVAGDRGGFMSAALVAVAPAAVLSARDARMYALAATLVLASSLLLWRAVEAPSWRRFACYGAVTALALYTDYFAALGVAAQMAALLLVRVRPRVLLWSAATAALAVVSLAPWLLAARSQLGHAGSAFWVPPIGFASVSGELVQFFSGPPVDPWVPGKPAVQVFQGFAVAAGVLASFALWRHRARIAPARRRVLVFILVAGLGGVLLLFPISFWRPVVDGRYASVVWAILFVAVAAGFALTRSTRLAAAGLALFAASSISLAAAQTHPDTPAVVADVEQRLGPHDLVAAYPTQYLLLLYYGDRTLVSRTRVVAPEVAWFWGTAAYPPGAIVASPPRDVVANNGTIFYAYEPADPGFSPPRGYALRSTHCWTGVCVDTYRR